MANIETLEVTPASYSVPSDYTSKAQVQAAWDAGKDFRIETFGPDMGRYINNADAARTPGLTVMIRYAKLQKVHVIRIK